MFENQNCNITPIDQASSLRRINTIDEISLVAVTGGKGGVGKTSVAINLSIALSDLHKNVMLLDADFGLSNVVKLATHHPKLAVRQLFNMVKDATKKD